MTRKIKGHIVRDVPYIVEQFKLSKSFTYPALDLYQFRETQAAAYDLVRKGFATRSQPEGGILVHIKPTPLFFAWQKSGDEFRLDWKIEEGETV